MNIPMGALCAAFFITLPVSAAPRFTLQPIPTFQVPGTDTANASFGRLDGFNDSGQLASTWYDSGYATYLYTPGIGYESMMPAGTQPGPSQPYGRELNNRGELAADFRSMAYVLRTGGAGAPVPGTVGTFSGAMGINDRGDVTGFREFPEGSFHPFVHTAAGFQTLPYSGIAYDINNEGQVLGESPTDAGRDMWIHDMRTGTLTPVDIHPGEGVGRAVLNDRLEAAVETVHGNERRAFLYREGGVTEVTGLQGSTANILSDFNNMGWVLGLSAVDVEGRAGYESFLDVPGEGSFALRSLIDPVGLAGWSDIGAMWLNDRGDIAGAGLHEGTLRLFVLSNAQIPMVPEPATAWLALTGLALLARRRRSTGE